ncbi:MAG TPA: response regulator [Terriglobia bacterium]|jgi:CheY-like chemotaxis protein
MSDLLKGISVLVVEDDLDTCELIQAVLRQTGANVVVANTVDAAIKQQQRSPAHVLVSDIRLGGSDGFALIAAIRQHDKQYRGFTPAIALTAYSSPGDNERARSAGFNAYILKPFEPADLVNAIFDLAKRPAEPAA